MDSIGIRIKRARWAIGMSKVSLAEAVRVSRNAIHKWENGLDVPSSSRIPALAKALGVSTDYLLIGGQLDVVHGADGSSMKIEAVPGPVGILANARNIMQPFAPLPPLRVESQAAADEQRGTVWAADVPEDESVVMRVHDPRLCRVRGDSALELVRPGQCVVIDAAITEVKESELCVVLTRDSSARLKRKALGKRDLRRYTSVNPAYPDFEVLGSEVIAEFPVVAILVRETCATTFETVDEPPSGASESIQKGRARRKKGPAGR
jgi:transcriptional regulator with XRE-family HTH domain